MVFNFSDIFTSLKIFRGLFYEMAIFCSFNPFLNLQSAALRYICFFVKIGHRYLENSACAVLQGTLALGNLKNLQGENMKERG